MAERKVPVTDPVEPRTRRGRRKMDDVKVGEAAAQSRFNEKQRQDAIRRRSKTAAMIEKEKQDALKAKKRAQRLAKLKKFSQNAARQALIVGPIVAPMAVAWTGQVGFAKSVLGWIFSAGLVYAAAYELTTVFCAWMYHEARKDGDKGWEYRIATWMFAAGSGLQQYWHYSANWAPTPRAITYSTMTAVGVIVWELYARLIHRRALRASGRISEARPRIELSRWLRFPRTAFIAWSISVNENMTSLDELWTRAQIERAKKRTDRDLKREIRTLNKQIADLTKQKPDPAGPKPGKAEDPAEIRVERVPEPRISGAEPRLSEGETRALPPGKSDSDPAEIINPEALNPATSDEAADGARGDEDEAGEFSPTDLEIKAIELLTTRGDRINRGNCAEAVRELGGGIATKRAALLADWGRTQKGEFRNLRAV